MPKKNPTHVNILGVKIPLDTLAHVTSSPPCGYMTYVMGSDALFLDGDVISTLKRPDTLFEALASPRPSGIPAVSGRTYQFFQYAALPGVGEKGRLTHEPL